MNFLHTQTYTKILLIVHGKGLNIKRLKELDCDFSIIFTDSENRPKKCSFLLKNIDFKL